MNNRFKNLATDLAERQAFDIEDIAQTIKVYFELWRSDDISNKLFDSDITKRRNVILARKRDIEIERAYINSQLDAAKIKHQRGEKTDADWFRRASYARRIKSIQIRHLQEDITNINLVQKTENAKKAEIRERKLNSKIFEILTTERGKPATIDFFRVAEYLVDQNILNKD